jgi:hypothetical protein
VDVEGDERVDLEAFDVYSDCRKLGSAGKSSTWICGRFGDFDMKSFRS